MKEGEGRGEKSKWRKSQRRGGDEGKGGEGREGGEEGDINQAEGEERQTAGRQLLVSRSQTLSSIAQHRNRGKGLATRD